jgi:hypothetical protein
MRRTIMVLVAAAGVAVATACTDPPRRVAGDAGPAGAPTATPATSTSPSTSVTRRPSSGPATSAETSSPPVKPRKPKAARVIGPARVLGPTGLGRLQIGMTTQTAEATGLVEAGEGDRDCGSWYLKPDVKGDAVAGWSSRGVVSIAAYDRIATPEGIRIGSTLDQVETAYDDLTGVAAEKDGGSWGDGPALAGQEDEYTGVHYRFLFVNGAVVKLKLEHDQPAC